MDYLPIKKGMCLETPDGVATVVDIRHDHAIVIQNFVDEDFSVVYGKINTLYAHKDMIVGDVFELMREDLCSILCRLESYVEQTKMMGDYHVSALARMAYRVLDELEEASENADVNFMDRN